MSRGVPDGRGGSTGRGDGARPVEVLLDDGAHAAGPGPDARGALGAAGGAGRDGAHPAARAARDPRRRAPLGALVVGLVLLGAAVDARAERRERADLAVHADVPGVLAPLGEPLAEVWRLPVHPALTAVGDRVVTVADGELVGLEAATGERRWRLRLRSGGSARCPVGLPGDGTAGTLVCEGVGRPEAAHAGVVAHGLDADDGRVVAELHGPRTVATVLGIDPDAVLVGEEAGFVRVSRLSLDGGRQHWRTRLAGLGAAAGDLVVHADRDVVALQGPTTVVLDARDGRELGRWTAATEGAASARVVSRPGVGFGVWTTRVAGRWYAPDGTAGPVLAGEPVEPDLADPGARGVVLLRTADGDRLQAVDPRTGRHLWDRPDPSRAVLLLGGRLVVVAGGRLEAWDVATGGVRWSVPLDRGEVPFRAGPFTDGVRLLVPGQDARGPRLTAVRIADGARVWQASLPTGSQRLVALGDRLAAVGRTDGGPEVAAVLG